MKKIKTALIFAMVAVLFSTGCNNPVIQPVIPSEDGIWDLGNVKIAASEAKNISNARAASSDGVEVVTQPCTESDFTGNDLLRFKEWNSVNQNSEVFTDEYISKMFKFETVTDITDKQTGFKVTYTKPADAPYTYMYWVNIVLFDKNGNMIVSQDVDDIFLNSDGYEWFFPYVDPKRNPKEPELIGLQFSAEGKYVNKMYKIKSNDGLGKPKDLPPYKEQKNHYVIDTNKKTYTLKNVKLPDEKDLIVKHQLLAITEKQIDVDGESIKRYPRDENGRSLYKLIAEVEQKISDSDKKNKRSFELNYKDLNGFADKADYPYWYIRTDFIYKNDVYKGKFSGVSLYSEIYDNDYFSIPTHERKNCSLKDAYYSEINNSSAAFDFSALKDLNKAVSFTITTKENITNWDYWAGISVNNNGPWTNISFEKGTHEYIFKLSDMKKIQDDAEKADPTKDHNYVVNFYPLLQSGKYSLDDIKLYDLATVTLNTNGGTVPESTIDCVIGPDISDTLPVPVYTEGFFGGWYTDSACTKAFGGKITGNTTLYAKNSDKLDVIKDVENLPQYGNIHFNYMNYMKNYSDKYLCFAITKSESIGAWVGVSVDNHEAFVSFYGEPAGTYKYAIKLSVIKEAEEAELAATNGTWGQDPHWNSQYLVFGQFLAEGSVYTLDELYFTTAVPEDFIELK